LLPFYQRMRRVSILEIYRKAQNFYRCFRSGNGVSSCSETRQELRRNTESLRDFRYGA
jgi:hypothetical protein